MRDHIIARQGGIAVEVPITGAGVNATVLDIDLDEHTVTLTVPTWDDGDRDWGPVRYIVGVGSGTIQEGSPAFLHVDSDGQPAYATVWGS